MSIVLFNIVFHGLPPIFFYKKNMCNIFIHLFVGIHQIPFMRIAWYIQVLFMFALYFIVIFLLLLLIHYCCCIHSYFCVSLWIWPALCIFSCSCILEYHLMYATNATQSMVFVRACVFTSKRHLRFASPLSHCRLFELLFMR